jgi:hypothetical protein
VKVDGIGRRLAKLLLVSTIEALAVFATPVAETCWRAGWGAGAGAEAACVDCLALASSCDVADSCAAADPPGPL